MNHKHIYKLKQDGDYFKVCSCGKKRKAIKKVKAKTLRNKCDAAWARITKKIHIAKHGNVCLWCGSLPNPLQSDHIINRWKTATRWNLSNCVVLCTSCHIFRKKREPFAWSQMVSENVPLETLEELDRSSTLIVKPDYQLILNELLEFEKSFDKDNLRPVELEKII